MLLSQRQHASQGDQQKKTLADLELFKMLLQPHFLFNSLNNLYALSVKNSDHTTDAIAGLSDLLGKVVAYSRKEYISLADEIELILGYINLERIWLGENSFYLDFKVEGDPDHFLVPPLLIYTFVENCFKHGIRKCAGEGWSVIKVKVKEDRLEFSAKNTIPHDDIVKSGVEETHGGFGVIAARELLERKCFGKYKLAQHVDNNIYAVDLMIIQENRKSA